MRHVVCGFASSGLVSAVVLAQGSAVMDNKTQQTHTHSAEEQALAQVFTQAVSSNNEGLELAKSHQYMQAIAHYQQALAQLQTLESKVPFRTLAGIVDEIRLALNRAAILNNLGASLNWTKQLPAAIAAFELAYNLRRKYIGDWAAPTLLSLHNLGLTQLSMAQSLKATTPIVVGSTAESAQNLPGGANIVAGQSSNSKREAPQWRIYGVNACKNIAAAYQGRVATLGEGHADTQLTQQFLQQCQTLMAV